MYALSEAFGVASPRKLSRSPLALSSRNARHVVIAFSGVRPVSSLELVSKLQCSSICEALDMVFKRFFSHLQDAAT